MDNDNLNIEDKVRELFNKFNQSVVEVCADKSKGFWERKQIVETIRQELKQQYYNLFQSKDEANKFNFIEILNSCHNEFTQKYFDFMTMIYTNFLGKKPKGTEAHIAMSERIEIDMFLNNENYLTLLSESEVTNKKFDDLMTIRYIFGKKDELLEKIFDNFRPLLKEKFPHLSSEIDQLLNENLNGSTFKLLLEVDKEGGYSSFTTYFNHDNFMKAIKANSLRDSNWEFSEDRLFKIIKSITDKNLDNYPEIQSLAKEFEKVTLSSAKDYEKNEYPQQNLLLLLSDLEKKQTLNARDLKNLIKRVDLNVLSKSTMNEEEIFSVLSRMIQLVSKVDRTLLYPDTFSLINLVKNVIVNRANLSGDEMTWLFNYRITNNNINLRPAVVCNYAETLNSETFSAVLGIANHLKLINSTFKDYLKNYL